MRRGIAMALLAVVGLSCLAHCSAQATTNTTSTNATASEPTPETAAIANFTAANITGPDTLVSRIEAGNVPAVNTSGQLTCQFNLVGAGVSTPVDVLSLDPSTQATGVTSAVIACTGSATNATIQGGPALASFTSNFSGRFSDLPVYSFCSLCTRG